MKAHFQAKGGVLGITGEYDLEELVKGEIQFWQPKVQEFEKPDSIKEVLNIADRAFDETFVSQLLTNLHQGLIRKWKERPQSELISIDSDSSDKGTSISSLNVFLGSSGVMSSSGMDRREPSDCITAIAFGSRASVGAVCISQIIGPGCAKACLMAGRRSSRADTSIA